MWDRLRVYGMDWHRNRQSQFIALVRIASLPTRFSFVLLVIRRTLRSTAWLLCQDVKARGAEQLLQRVRVEVVVVVLVVVPKLSFASSSLTAAALLFSLLSIPFVSPHIEHFNHPIAWQVFSLILQL